MKLLRHHALALLVAGLAAAPLIAQSTAPASTSTGTSASTSAGAPAKAQPAAPTTPATTPPGMEKVDVAKLPAVVAKVKGTEITKDQLLKAVQTRADGLQRMGVRVPSDTKMFYRQVLDSMVAAQLLSDESVALGFAPSADDIERELGNIKQGFENETAFKEALVQQQMTEAELRSEVKDDISIKKLVETKVAPNVKVDEPAMRDFYEENKSRMQEPEKFLASHILVKLDEGATAEAKAAARKQADELLAKIKGGGDFAQAAKESSDDPGSKESGGALPWLSRGQTVPPFEQAALSLKAGELSGVVESPFGFHIIKLLDRKEARTVPFDEAKAKIEEYLKQQGLKAEIEKHVTELRAKSGAQLFI